MIGGEGVVLPAAAEDRAAHPHGRSGRLVLQIPIITHGPGRGEEERKEEWVEGERLQVEIKKRRS